MSNHIKIYGVKPRIQYVANGTLTEYTIKSTYDVEPGAGAATLSASTYATEPYTVIQIGDGGFFDQDVVNVQLPNTVKTIGRLAFAASNSLQSFDFPNNLETIGYGAFASIEEYNTAFVSITIPASVTLIDESAFNACYSLVELNFEQNSQLTTIGANAFVDCKNLKIITIPANVTTIGEMAFKGVARESSIESLTFLSTNPSSITIGSDSAFWSATVVYVPNGCTDAYRTALTNYNSTWGASVAIEELPA